MPQGVICMLFLVVHLKIQSIIINYHQCTFKNEFHDTTLLVMRLNKRRYSNVQAMHFLINTGMFILAIITSFLYYLVTMQIARIITQIIEIVHYDIGSATHYAI